MTQAPIVEEFLELVALNVGSRRERAMADVLKDKLAALGLIVEEDGVGALIGGEAGNLIARLHGDPNYPPLLFSAHMDRVVNHGRICPRVEAERDIIVSDGTSILAADDVSGIVSILDGLRRVLADDRPHGEIEIVFSVAEEVGLLGARHLNYAEIKSKMAYVVDSIGPLGFIINQAPTQFNIFVTLHGRSAHAGLEPEKGLSAIRVAATALTRLREGRLSLISTSNFGIVQAGVATNIVCDRCEIKGEARSTDPAEVAAYLEETRRIFEDTAAEFGAVLDFKTSLEYKTFRVDESELVIKLAEEAMKNMGLSPIIASGGGGMDGNHFNQHGLTAIGLSPGYFNPHTPQERQSLSQLIRCGALIAEIILSVGQFKNI
ncbi:MAG: M20/M25/M40 family metallo-hydrolase [Candidatus Adiutrix intracellularis]|nr:M20/M25/M40 family metallo-hydrolase [Candidatus Adiutrix intracellularis]